MSASSSNLQPAKHKPRNITGAVLLIGAGIILLLNNFNLLPWSVWAEVWQFWPVLLIMAGIEIIFNRSWLAQALIVIISLLAFFWLTREALSNPHLPFSISLPPQIINWPAIPYLKQ